MIIIYFFLIIFGASFVYLKLAELFLPQEKQESFNQSLREIESEINNKGTNWTVLSPLYYMSSFLDKYLGERLVSCRSIYLASMAIGILVITNIWLTSITTDKSDFIKNSPVQMWNQGIVIMKKTTLPSIISKESTSEQIEEAKQYNLKLEQRRDCLSKLSDSGGGATIFTVILLVSCVATIVVLSSLTLAITRQVLREMIYAKGVVTLIGGTIVNILLIILLGSFFGLFLFLISSPFYWPILDGLIHLLTMNKIWSLVAYMLGTILAGILLPGWIKLVVLISLTPIILLMFSLLLSTIMFFFRKPIHASLVILLRRALAWKAGPIAFLAALAGLLTFIFSWLYK